MTTPTPPTPLINWHALGQVLGTSVAFGIGLVVIFSVGVFSLSLYRRPNATTVVRSANAAVVALMTLIIAGSVYWGFYLIVHK